MELGDRTGQAVGGDRSKSDCPVQRARLRNQNRLNRRGLIRSRLLGLFIAMFQPEGKGDRRRHHHQHHQPQL